MASAGGSRPRHSRSASASDLDRKAAASVQKSFSSLSNLGEELCNSLWLKSFLQEDLADAESKVTKYLEQSELDSAVLASLEADVDRIKDAMLNLDGKASASKELMRTKGVLLSDKINRVQNFAGMKLNSHSSLRAASFMIQKFPECASKFDYRKKAKGRDAILQLSMDKAAAEEFKLTVIEIPEIVETPENAENIDGAENLNVNFDFGDDNVDPELNLRL